jgi:hypothetical protein
VEIFAPQAIPTLSEWMQILMAVLLVAGGLWTLGHRRQPAS